MNTAVSNMFTSDRTETFSFPPVSAVDPFGSVLSHQQTIPSFANFDNNPVFSTSPAPTIPTSASFPSGLKVARPPSEDKYAALKDLDSLMKQQQETATPPPVAAAPAPPSGVTEWGETKKSANPFTSSQPTPIPQNGFGSNVSNPFRSGFDVMGGSSLGGSPSPWASFSNDSSNISNLPTSHSMPFPVSWATPSDLTVGPSQSRNPFL